MLVLTRQPDEEILIGDDIRITVVAISGSQVRLGIEAPRSVPVLRSEVCDAVAAQNEAAAQASPAGLRAMLRQRHAAPHPAAERVVR
jgi:carbon storage regulator